MDNLKRAFEDYLYEIHNDFDITMAAAHALARGIHSTALCELAGLSKTDTYEVPDLVTLTIQELRISPRSRPTVEHEHAKEVARQYFKGDLTFQNTLTRILELVYTPFNDFDIEHCRETHHGLKDPTYLDEWAFGYYRGYFEDVKYWFGSEDDAEAYFVGLAKDLVEREHVCVVEKY